MTDMYRDRELDEAIEDMMAIREDCAFKDAGGIDGNRCSGYAVVRISSSVRYDGVSGKYRPGRAKDGYYNTCNNCAEWFRQAWGDEFLEISEKTFGKPGQETKYRSVKD